MKYEILVAGSPGALEDQVQACIDKGWRPQGGVTMGMEPMGRMLIDSPQGYSVRCMQAMIKEEVPL